MDCCETRLGERALMPSRLVDAFHEMGDGDVQGIGKVEQSLVEQPPAAELDIDQYVACYARGDG